MLDVAEAILACFFIHGGFLYADGGFGSAVRRMRPYTQGAFVSAVMVPALLHVTNNSSHGTRVEGK